MLYEKLRAGTLKKHSEQMNKWLAGFIDSDGSISLHIKRHSNGRYGVYLQVAICQTDASLLHLLCAHYGLGSVSGDTWHLSGKDAHMLMNLVGKHLLIKATHLDNLLWLIGELKGLSIREPEDIREFSICSRENTKWRHEPKHIPYAWLAGYTDGDGHWRCRVGRERRFRDGTSCLANELKLFLGAQPSDSFVLKKLHQDHGGSLKLRKDGLWFWQLSLGANSRSRAIVFLRKIRKYVCLPRKAEAIDSMLAFHATRRD